MTNTFSDRLNEALIKTATPKSKLALMIGTKPSTVSGWLSGKYPTVNNLISISRALNISLCWLVNGLGPMHMYGPLHISPDEENLLLQLRFFPKDISRHLLNFLALASQHESDIELINCARASRVLNAADLAMAVFDNNFLIRDINNEFLKLLNIPEELKKQLINTYFIDWLSTKDKGKMIMSLNNAKMVGSIEGLHCDLIHYDSDDFTTVIFSGAYHGSAEKGFFLITAFLLPKKTR